MDANSLKVLRCCVEEKIADLQQTEECFMLSVKTLEDRFPDYSITLEWDEGGRGSLAVLKATHLPSGTVLSRYPTFLNDLESMSEMVDMIKRTLFLANGMKYELF